MNDKIQQSLFQTQFANIGLLNDQISYLINKVEAIDNKLQSPLPALTDEKEDIIQVKEAAKVIGRSVSTVYIKASKKEIPCWNDSGRLLFSRKDLKKWILANKDKANDNDSLRNQMKKIRSTSKKK